MSHKSLLFNTPYPQLNNQPIFSNQNELVSCLVKKENISNDKFVTRQKSIYSLVNAALNGKKKLTRRIRENFEEILNERLSVIEEPNFVIQKIMNSIHELFDQNNPSPDKEDLISKSSLKIYYERAQKSEEVLMISKSPVELSNEKIGFKIIKTIAENLGFYDERISSTKYNYLFPNDNYDQPHTAMNFWTHFYNTCKTLGISNLDHKIKDANESGKLKVFSIPYNHSLFMLPATWYDRNSIYEESYTTYLTGEFLQIFKMHDYTFGAWKENTNEILRRHPLENNEVSFDKALKVIERKNMINSYP